MKKVGKTSRSFKYDLNQFPYNYTVDMTNRFKELDLIDRVPEELWTEVHNIVQEAVIKTIPKRQVLGPGALGRPRGIRWRGRWEGGSGWGIHVNPWLIHVNVRQKPLQYSKVISLQLIKKIKKKKKKTSLRKRDAVREMVL